MSAAALARPQPEPLLLKAPDPAEIRERVAQVAYALWEQRGCPEGSPEEDWRAAEEQVGVR